MSGVWRSDIERDAWQERWCANCFQPDEARLRATGKGGGCPHNAAAEAHIMPAAWSRQREQRLGDTYRCKDFLEQPAVARRNKAPVEDVPMFDVEPADRYVVPVDGWPDYRAAMRKKGTDHQ